MADKWRASHDPVGGWYWHYGEFPNGWSPQVSDWSQSIAPVQPTRYKIAAISKHQIIQGKETYPTLEWAKREAILFALEQRNAEEVWLEATSGTRP